MKLRIVCAWCKRVMQIGDYGAPTSHGICDHCSKRIEEEEKESA